MVFSFKQRLYGLITLIGLCLTLGTCVQSQHESTSQEELAGRRAPSKERRGLLWQAQRKAQTVILVGTMHVGIAPEELPQLLWDKLAQADVVITETDLKGITVALSQRFLIAQGSNRLDTQLGPQDWQKFLAIIAQAFPQMPEESLRRMTPLAAASHLMLAEAQLALNEKKAARVDVQAQSSMDQLIVSRAQAQGKSLRYFESVREQFSYLEQVFNLEQLRTMLAESQKNREEFKKLASTFREGDAETLETLIKEIPPELRRLLLDERNERWAKNLDSLLSPATTFIAVGAAHLGGPSGLVHALEEKGFSLKPLRAK